MGGAAGMPYIIILILVLIIIILAVQFCFINRALRGASKQMEDIEKHPERNRQLTTFATNRRFEELLNRINRIYQTRQQERIIYQRRETQIRREIENVSHDLRTPLTSIIGYVDLIQDGESSEADKQEYLNIIHKRARVLQGFIQDFYEISRIEGENYPLLLSRIPVQPMVSEAVVAYYNEFDKRDIKVSVELEEKQCSIIADKIQFNRILNNLIQNALKYADKLFVIRQFTIAGWCVLQFQNDKYNMKEEELKLIFDRFYVGDQTRNEGSTGLGLTITKILVEKMKGSIEARLEENMFVIELRWKQQ
jgi:signal transduction histidine kinase